MFKLNFKIYVGLSGERIMTTRLSVATGEQSAILIIRKREDVVSVIMDSKETGQRVAHLHQVIEDHRQNLSIMTSIWRFTSMGCERYTKSYYINVSF